MFLLSKMKKKLGTYYFRFAYEFTFIILVFEITLYVNSLVLLFGSFFFFFFELN